MNAYQHELDGKKWKDAYNHNRVRIAQGKNRAAKSDYRPRFMRSSEHIGAIQVRQRD